MKCSSKGHEHADSGNLGTLNEGEGHCRRHDSTTLLPSQTLFFLQPGPAHSRYSFGFLIQAASLDVQVLIFLSLLVACAALEIREVRYPPLAPRLFPVSQGRHL